MIDVLRDFAPTCDKSYPNWRGESRACGIYLIKNNVNGKCYVGSSVDVGKRLRTHQSKLRNSKHANPHLQSAYNLYGEGSFSTSVLELCDPCIMIQRETHWTEEFRAIKNGYNIRVSAESNRGIVWSNEVIEKRRLGLLEQRAPLGDSWKLHLSKIGKENGNGQRIAAWMKKNGSFWKGKKLNPDAVKKMAASKTGQKMKPEIRDANKKQLNSIRPTRAGSLIDPSGNQHHFRITSHFCKEHNLSASAVSLMLDGKRTSHKGWTIIKCT